MNAALRVMTVAGSIALTTACAPVINSVTVSPGADVNLVNVRANISDAAAASQGTPELHVASLAENPPVFRRVAGDFTAVSGAVHQRDGLALPAGQFRVQVIQPYTPLFSTSGSTVTATRDVTIAPPLGCFFFDGSTEGWTVDGFFEIVTTSPTDFGTRVPLCAGQAPALRTDGPNFPTPYSSTIPSAFGSLTMSANPLFNACFSNVAPAPQTGFVVFDLNSPDLSGRPGWTGATGFEMQARGINLLGATTDPPIRAQLLLLNTANQVFRPENASGQPVFTTLGTNYAAASFVRPATALSRVRVRVFVPGPLSQQAGVATQVNFDRICPRTN